MSILNFPPFRRRQYLIDRRGQLLATAKVTGLVLVLLVLLNLVYVLWSAIETQAIISANPLLADEMRAIDRRSTAVLVVVSAIVLVIVVIRSIMLTHRTAGAAFNLRRCLTRVAAGDYDTVLRVRRKDNLRELQVPFNEMMRSLRERADEDRAALSNLASKIDEIGHPELAEEVRAMARAKAELANPSESD